MDKVIEFKDVYIIIVVVIIMVFFVWNWVKIIKKNRDE